MSSLSGYSRWRGAVCGLLAAAVAMGVGQLFAAFTFPAASPVVAVGEVVIDHTPLPVKDWATSTFGTGDKTVLVGGVLVVVFLYSMLVGVLAMRRLALGFAGLVIFGGLGLAAALTRHDASVSYAVPTVFGALAGAIALLWLVRTARAATTEARARRAARDPGALPPIAFRPDDYVTRDADQAGSGTADGGTATGGTADDGTAHGGGTSPDNADDEASGWIAAGAASSEPAQAEPARPEPARPEPTRAGPPMRGPAAPWSATPARRQFLVAAGTTVAAAAIGELGGRNLAERKDVTLAQQAIRFPKASVAAPPLPAGINPAVPGITPFITSNSQFYRVDTAIVVPQVSPSSWTLRIHGMVAREVTITFDQLLHRPLIENYTTLACVSDPVDGPYISNAKWLGASLAALIRSAGPQRGADQLLCTSVDGFTSGTPLQVVLDGRDALVAVAMNGTALPTEHGFPARLVVPGLYGYVSACKWVVDIEVTTFAQAQGYWVPLGWSQLGPIKTESRIDVPTNGKSLKAGKVPVAGVAWAQHKGIEAVEARVDHGPWNEATLASVPGIDTWRQWVWEWDATPGTHLIEARATDKTGYTQTSVTEDVAPNGASGYPSTQVTVS